MSRTRKIGKNNISYMVLILWFLFNIILFPTTAIEGASKGLATWFNVVVPSLLPFFITSGLLIELGTLNIVGSFLEPVMMPIFNVPGLGAFPFVLSLTSGYPVGVKLISRLRQNGNLSKIEAQRLLSFSSTSGPLFMLGAVSVGMLKNSSLAPLIIYPHYLAAFTLGILFRNYKKYPYNMHKKSDKRPISSLNNRDLNISQLLSNVIKDATNSIIIIGGFITLYSVVIEIIYESIFFNYVIKYLTLLLPFNINPDVIKGIFAGIIEITVGCKKIATSSLPLIWQLVIINFMIGWSGLSIHSQALSFLAKTDINPKLYIGSKFFHGILSSFYSFIFCKLFYHDLVIESFIGIKYLFQDISQIKWTKIFALSWQNLLSALIGIAVATILINTFEKFIRQ